MFRVPNGAELLNYLNVYAEKNDLLVGVVNVIGALFDVKIGYYDIEKDEYKVISLRGFYELVAGIGDISIKEQKPFTHLHVVLDSSNGESYAGHLMEGKVFVAETIIYELEGPVLERKRLRKDYGCGKNYWGLEPICFASCFPSKYALRFVS